MKDSETPDHRARSCEGVSHSRARHPRCATQKWSGAADGTYRHDTSSRRFPRCRRATSSRSPSWVLERLFVAHPVVLAWHGPPTTWCSIELMQQQLRGQRGTNMHLTYQYKGHAGFHVLQAHAGSTDSAVLCSRWPISDDTQSFVWCWAPGQYGSQCYGRQGIARCTAPSRCTMQMCTAASSWKSPARRNVQDTWTESLEAPST